LLSTASEAPCPPLQLGQGCWQGVTPPSPRRARVTGGAPLLRRREDPDRERGATVEEEDQSFCSPPTETGATSCRWRAASAPSVCQLRHGGFWPHLPRFARGRARIRPPLRRSQRPHSSMLRRCKRPKRQPWSSWLYRRRFCRSDPPSRRIVPLQRRARARLWERGRGARGGAHRAWRLGT
jgi:hypothetical protein